MRAVRSRLTYANVMSTIGMFLLLAGGTAVAAKQLGKKTVGPKQLKSNAVTTAKIKKAAVTKAKIKDGAIDTTKIADNAVTGAKIADGSVGGADINAAGTSFSQITTRLRNNSTVVFGPSTVYPLGTYTQQPNENNQFMAAVDVAFAAGCTQPRTAQALLLLNAANPAVPTPTDIIGVGVVQDTGAGAVTRRVDFTTFGGFQGMSRVAPLSATQHTFSVFLLTSSCTAGAGVNATGALLDVISTK